MAKAKIAKREEARLKDELNEEEDAYEEIPAPPDGGYGWVIVGASFLCNLVIDGTGFSFGILLPALIDAFDSSKGTVAWVGSLMAGSVLAGGPLVSAVTNRYGCRLTCIAGALIASVSLAASVYSPNITVLMLVYGLCGGLGFSFMYLPAVVMVGYYFESKRSLATGIAVCGTGVGTFAVAPLAAFLLPKIGWTGAVLVLSGIALCCCLCGLLMKPLPTVNKTPELKELKVPVNRARTSEGNVSSREVYNSTMSITRRRDSVAARKDILYTGSIQNLREFQSKRSIDEYRHSVHSLQRPRTPTQSQTSEAGESLVDFSLFRDPVFLLIAISNFIAFIAFYIPFFYIVELAKNCGIEASKAAFLISVIGFTNTIGRIIVGFIADFPKVNNLLVNNLCILLAGISTAAFSLCSGYASFIVVCLIFGLAVAGYMSLTSIIIVELLGLDKLTNAFGLVMLFRGMAALIGSPIAGSLYDFTNSFVVPFVMGGVMFAIAAGISAAAPYFQKKNKKGTQELYLPVNGQQ